MRGNKRHRQASLQNRHRAVGSEIVWPLRQVSLVRYPQTRFTAKKFEEIDPDSNGPRKLCMLVQERHKNHLQPPFKVAVSDESKSVTRDHVNFSKETVWMISVRDNRDRGAFSDLFDHFAPRLKGFVMRTGASSELAEEIVQDAMLTVWRKAALFDPHRAQVSAWIYQIARNRQIDIARREKRPMPEELKEPSDIEPDASQILGLQQEAAQLKKALAQLKPTQRDVIERAYIGELTQQEISAQTGLPLGTIKSRIRLGLERLRHELKDLKQ